MIIIIIVERAYYMFCAYGILGRVPWPVAVFLVRSIYALRVAS